MTRSCRSGSDDHRCCCVTMYLYFKKVKTKVLVSKEVLFGLWKDAPPCGIPLPIADAIDIQVCTEKVF